MNWNVSVMNWNVSTPVETPVCPVFTWPESVFKKHAPISTYKLTYRHPRARNLWKTFGCVRMMTMMKRKIED